MTKAPYILIESEQTYDLIILSCRAAHLDAYDREGELIHPTVFYMFADPGYLCQLSDFATLEAFKAYCLMHNRPYVHVNSIPHFVSCALAYRAHAQRLIAQIAGLQIA